VYLFFVAQIELWFHCNFLLTRCCHSTASKQSNKIIQYYKYYICLGTNLIHDFTAVAFSVKLAFFHKMLISVKSMIFLRILTLLLSFVKVSELYQQHLCGFCCLLCVTLSEHLTVLSLDLVFIYAVNIRCSEISNVLFDRLLSLH